MKRLYYLIYNLLLAVLFVLYLPVAFYKLIIKGRYREGLKERFGFLPRSLKYLQEEQVIWVHAASVGETMAASSLVKELKRKHPEYQLVFSTMSDTGRETAQQVVGEQVKEIIYLPLDFGWVVRRVLKKLQPRLIVLIETELWPNLIRQTKRSGAKVMVASGRISDESIDRFKYLGPLLKEMLAQVDCFSMQSELDAQRIIELGAAEDKVKVDGNIKFDKEYPEFNEEDQQQLYQQFKLDPQRPILVAGSTHADEEEQLIEVYQRICEEYPDLVLIIAPRYPKRTEEIEQLFEEEGLETVRRTKIEERDPEQHSIILVDTIGELIKLYSMADLVFVGGSLIERGGHNILEPAACGKLVFFGPHMFNFKENTKMLLESEAGVQVEDSEELAEEMVYYLRNSYQLQRKGRQARQVILNNQGAVEANLHLISNLLRKNILIVRLSAIGDVIHALPVANAVRESYPEAEITWIVERKAYDLVANNPHLNRVLLFPKESWKEEFKQAKRATLKKAYSFLKGLKEYDFDLVLDLHGLFKSGIVTYFSRAPLRVGAADSKEGSRLFYNQLAEVEPDLHKVERNLNLAREIGAESKVVTFDFAVAEKEVKKINSLLAKLPLDFRAPWVAINPYTSWTSKNWPEEYYAQLTKRLIEELDCEVFLTGSPADREGVAGIRARFNEKVYNLAGETNLKELTELYKRMNLFIGGDTGPMHLAAAVNTQVLALMGPTTPQTHGPYGNQHRVVRLEGLDCLECWDRSCEQERACMEELSVEQVFRAVKDCLEGD
ncbi:lipopolysaccharide heptosyltransferase II [Fuchsiella alkaliacetigena]|uniref:lipopolysaccharide heptosyltransferase II n=1 Tax=Fuchsiella alkaliacetigena TaxID=957042 RepID=UPI00200AF407|nr:lipopolysaccharide heptosyltransferase II [Fuchsiella alkaliacetigena]MCK8824295.1 lipopolysaccharide heptosyltransferase II [Fuchsiella alkaliacetigena]